MTSSSEKALQLLRYMPRMDLMHMTKQHPYKKLNRPQVGKQYSWWRWVDKNKVNRNIWRAMSHQRYAPIGFNDGFSPFWLQTPQEFYYKNFDNRRQYPPLSLQQLQLMIDTKLIDPTKPIDLATIYRTNHYKFDPAHNHFGIRLTEEGMDRFVTKVNIEVGHADEAVIAAVERRGGVITTAYYDMESIRSLYDPLKFFKKGEAIPKRLLPPQDAIEYYASAKSRGYLADPIEVERERFILSQKFGYVLPDIKNDPLYDMLSLRKHRRQIFYGLEPGWVVNLRDQEILEPTDELLQKFYSRDIAQNP